MPVSKILYCHMHHYKDIEELSVALHDLMEPRNIPTTAAASRWKVGYMRAV
jgi:hypothetical protein